MTARRDLRGRGRPMGRPIPDGRVAGLGRPRAAGG